MIYTLWDLSLQRNELWLLLSDFVYSALVPPIPCGLALGL